MEVHGAGSVQGAYPVRSLRPASEVAPPRDVKPIETRDEVEISSAGKMMESLNQSMRAERLAQIKSAIEAGEYETPDKLEIALERLLAEVRDDGA